MIVYVFWPWLSGMQIAPLYVLLHCRLQSLWLYHIFPYYLINGTTDRLYFLNIRCFLMFSTTYNTPRSFSRVACLFLRESKCSMWWNNNLINNQTLLILFILFHNCWNLQMCWMYGCAFEKIVHYQPRYHVHNLSPPEYTCITDFFLHSISEISSSKFIPP